MFFFSWDLISEVWLLKKFLDQFLTVDQAKISIPISTVPVKRR